MRQIELPVCHAKPEEEGNSVQAYVSNGQLHNPGERQAGILQGSRRLSEAVGACPKVGLAQHSMQVGAQHINCYFNGDAQSRGTRPYQACYAFNAFMGQQQNLSASAKSIQEVRLLRRSPRNGKTQSWRELF